MMTGKTKAQMRRHLDRWKLVNEREKEELRATRMETKLLQLASLMASAETFGWKRQTPAEIAKSREPWNRLRRNHAL